MNIVFTGGGTAGHVLPGIAVLEHLPKEWECHWIGSYNGIEKKIITQDMQNIQYYPINVGKLRRYFSWQNFIDPFKILLGILQSLLYLRKMKPEFIFSKGGFVSVPVIIAGFFLKIPCYSHESDLVCGLATKINSRFSKRIFLSYDQSLKTIPTQLKSKTLVVGSLVRNSFFKKKTFSIREKYGIPPESSLVLILGGSSGAKQLNNLILPLYDSQTKPIFILHQMGESLYEARENQHYKTLPYITNDMPALLHESILVVSRAGAGAISEFIATKTPMILIPLGKKNSRGDQIVNANFLESQHAAFVLDEEKITTQDLWETIKSLEADTNMQKKLTEHAKKALRVEGASYIAKILEEDVKKD